MGIGPLRQQRQSGAETIVSLAQERPGSRPQDAACGARGFLRVGLAETKEEHSGVGRLLASLVLSTPSSDSHQHPPGLGAGFSSCH